MIVRAGTPVSFPVMFSSGVPDTVVSWEVLGPDGVVLSAGTIDPAPDAVSINLAIAPALTELGDGELFSYRDVVWSYTSGGQSFSDERRFTIEARLPFGVSPDGVRNKLGVDAADLPNSDISLVTAYYRFEELVSEPVLQAATLLGGQTQIILRDAIEAYAALALLPTMVVRIADKESSGTNQYQRQKIDWAQVQLALQAQVGAGQTLLVPGYDPTVNFGALLILASPASDPFPGG